MGLMALIVLIPGVGSYFIAANVYRKFLLHRVERPKTIAVVIFILSFLIIASTAAFCIFSVVFER